MELHLRSAREKKRQKNRTKKQTGKEDVERLIPEEGLGFKRLMPLPCEAGELDTDVLIISHEHKDHFDVDALGFVLDFGFSRLYYAGDTALTLSTGNHRAYG